LTLAIKQTAYWVGGIAAAVGLVVGLLVMWFFKRKPAKAV